MSRIKKYMQTKNSAELPVRFFSEPYVKVMTIKIV